MSEQVEILRTGEADRRLLMKLQQRLLTTAAPDPAPVTREDRRLEMAFALVPMALAFLYLTVLMFFLFR